MPLATNITSSWRKIGSPQTSISSVWKPVIQIYANDSGIWRKMYTYQWHLGGWGGCSASCGGGSQSREVYCKTTDGIRVVDQYCLSATGSKPSTSQSCNTHSCMTCYPLMYRYTKKDSYSPPDTVCDRYTTGTDSWYVRYTGGHIHTNVGSCNMTTYDTRFINSSNTTMFRVFESGVPYRGNTVWNQSGTYNGVEYYNSEGAASSTCRNHSAPNVCSNDPTSYNQYRAVCYR